MFLYIFLLRSFSKYVCVSEDFERFESYLLVQIDMDYTYGWEVIPEICSSIFWFIFDMDMSYEEGKGGTLKILSTFSSLFFNFSILY